MRLKPLDSDDDPIIDQIINKKLEDSATLQKKLKVEMAELARVKEGRNPKDKFSIIFSFLNKAKKKIPL